MANSCHLKKSWFWFNMSLILVMPEKKLRKIWNAEDLMDLEIEIWSGSTDLKEWMDTKHSPTNVGLSFGGGGSQLSSSVSNLFWSQQFLFKQFHSVAGGAVIVKFIVFYMTCLSKSPGTRPGQSRLTKYFPRDVKVLSSHAIVAGNPLSCKDITNSRSLWKKQACFGL